MNLDLVALQRLQFSDKHTAERLLVEHLTDSGVPDVSHVQLNPKPESLNSINGFVTFVNGTRLFFKSHTEEHEQVHEYYNARALADAGYPVVEPRQVLHVPGQQIAFYEIIDFPTLFDEVAREERADPHQITQRGEHLIHAQRTLEEKILSIYLSTLHEPHDTARAPIHQLFSHRLDHEGRLGLFYSNAEVSVGTQTVSTSDLFRCTWVINGVEYPSALAELVESARDLLDPRLPRPSIIGHGDAHNGNVFIDGTGDLRYFDPAFAGRHDPLLDLVKPLAHNVFSRWMYFPEEVDDQLELRAEIRNDRIFVDHSFELSALRRQFLSAKRDALLHPLVTHLSTIGLGENWQSFVRAALLCCPLLTVNLAAPFDLRGKLAERYSPSIKLLGFSIAVELGSAPRKGSSRIADDIASLFEL